VCRPKQQCNKPSATQLLLLAGASVNCTAAAAARIVGMCLHVAAWQGLTEVMRSLLAAGADVETSWGGITPLYAAAAAAAQGHDEIVQVLLAAGDNVDATTPAGRSPLFVAAREGHIAIGSVQLLLHYHANPWLPDVDATPLMMAGAYGHLRIVQLLLEAWGQPPPTAADLVMPTQVAAYRGHMPPFAALAKELRKQCPEEAQQLFQGYFAVPGARPLAAVLDARTCDVSSIDEQRAQAGGGCGNSKSGGAAADCGHGWPGDACTAGAA
jgi:hypothetical protein